MEASTLAHAQVAHVRSERNALAESAADCIVRLHYSFQDEEQLYLVMDFCPGGDLMSLLIREDVLPEAWVRVYAAEAAMAVAAVHSLGYIHRDLKPGALARVRATTGHCGPHRLCPLPRAQTTFFWMREAT